MVPATRSINASTSSIALLATSCQYITVVFDKIRLPALTSMSVDSLNLPLYVAFRSDLLLLISEVHTIPSIDVANSTAGFASLVSVLLSNSTG